MVFSWGFDANVLGSNPNSGDLSFFDIFDNCYFSKHKLYNFTEMYEINHRSDLYENLIYTSMYN